MNDTPIIIAMYRQSDWEEWINLLFRLNPNTLSEFALPTRALFPSTKFSISQLHISAFLLRNIRNLLTA